MTSWENLPGSVRYEVTMATVAYARSRAEKVGSDGWCLNMTDEQLNLRAAFLALAEKLEGME